MDTMKIGKFLKQLRNEKNMTQEQLGEKLGVTNKTVSRWETGNYLPPVECLILLSDIYEISINEILQGERILEENFKEKADENLTIMLGEVQQENKKFENKMLIILAISTLLAIAIIIMLPLNSIRDFIIMIMVIALAFISNTLNLVINIFAMAYKKENSKE